MSFCKPVASIVVRSPEAAFDLSPEADNTYFYSTVEYLVRVQASAGRELWYRLEIWGSSLTVIQVSPCCQDEISGLYISPKVRAEKRSELSTEKGEALSDVSIARRVSRSEAPAQIYSTYALVRLPSLAGVECFCRGCHKTLIPQLLNKAVHTPFITLPYGFPTASLNSRTYSAMADALYEAALNFDFEPLERVLAVTEAADAIRRLLELNVLRSPSEEISGELTDESEIKFYERITLAAMTLRNTLKLEAEGNRV